MLKRMETESLLEVQDLSAMVAEQRERLSSGLDRLETPSERVYVPADVGK
jgi:hypothetical protein